MHSTGITVNLTDNPIGTQFCGPPLAHPNLSIINWLKDAIASCLSIALSIETMTGTHHALVQVLESATPLQVNAVIEYAKETNVSADLKTAVGKFAKEMNHVQEIIQDLPQRTPEARRVLWSIDVLVISPCASSMRFVCDVLRSTSFVEHGFRSVDDGIGALKQDVEIENCSCGIPLEPEQTFSP